MIWHTVPRLVRSLFPRRIWEKPSEDRIYLTFDDGPVPGVSDFVMEELAKRKQKATFFAVGDNLARHPELAKELLAEGHQLANHTYNHLNGWKTSNEDYLENVQRCDETLRGLGVQTTLFRPPYGLLSPAQASRLSLTHELVMWSLLTGDYDRSLSPKTILTQSKKRAKPGQIVVFHDQQKTREVVRKILPDFLDFVEAKGWKTGLL